MFNSSETLRKDSTFLLKGKPYIASKDLVVRLDIDETSRATAVSRLYVDGVLAYQDHWVGVDNDDVHFTVWQRWYGACIAADEPQYQANYTTWGNRSIQNDAMSKAIRKVERIMGSVAVQVSWSKEKCAPVFDVQPNDFSSARYMLGLDENKTYDDVLNKIMRIYTEEYTMWLMWFLASNDYSDQEKAEAYYVRTVDYL